MVGLPASGKTTLAALLAEALALPVFSIDAERDRLTDPGRAYWFGRDPEAWFNLAERLDAETSAIVEDAGLGEPHLWLLQGRRVLALECVADWALRRRRLIARGQGDAYAERLAGYEQRPEADLEVDTLDAQSVAKAVIAARRFLA